MSQQINLFNPRFRHEKRYLTAPALALMAGVALFGALAFAVAARGRAEAAEAEAAEVKAALQEAETRKQTTLTALVQRPKDASVGEQLARAEAEHRALQGVAAILEQNRVGDPRGYATYFQALARSRVPGVWLTGVDISGTAADIGLRGRALRAELLPGYLNGLAREPVLQGKAFGSVAIAQPAPVQVPAPVDAPAPVPAAVPGAAVTLAGASGGAGGAAPAAQPAQPVPAAPAPPIEVIPRYIEFTLQASGERAPGVAP